jgi:uncharacterized protein (TIGR02996 family)
MTTFKDFFPELLHKPSNGTFLVFADLLEEAGRDTQAALVRASLRLRDDLTPTEQALLGVSSPLGREDREALLVAERDLQRQFITELGPEIASILQNEPHRISFDRGVIESIDLSLTPIAHLPKDLQVGRHLCLYETPIAALPEGLQVVGNLSLYETPIAALPDGLQVGGSLDLYGTQIAALPEGLQVGGTLDLSETRITSLPEGLQIGGALYLVGTRITSLPEDLQVSGNLYLSGTRLSPEAAARILKMPGLSDAAKITGLKTAGYPNLADQVTRRAGQAAQQKQTNPR